MKLNPTKYGADKILLNNNMRCFEIYKPTDLTGKINELNNNMRCFEIYKPTDLTGKINELNNNMRCFEMRFF